MSTSFDFSEFAQVKGAKRRYDKTGMRFGRLVVQGVTPTPPLRWVCLCDCGTQIEAKSGNLTSGNTKSCGCLMLEMARERAADKHPLWQEEVKYAAAHIRVQRVKGRAADHPCVDCQQPARDWSYVGGDPEERTEMVKGSPRRYSLDPERYVPRCRSCHLSLDFGGAL